MKSFKILIIAMLLIASWNGFGQNAAPGSQSDLAGATTINQDDDNPSIIPANKRVIGSITEPMSIAQPGIQNPAEEEDSPAVKKNTNAKYTNIDVPESKKPVSVDPESPDYDPAYNGLEKVNPKKSEL